MGETVRIVACACGNMQWNAWARQWACTRGRCPAVTEQTAAERRIGQFAPVRHTVTAPSFYTQYPADPLEYVRPDLFRSPRPVADRETHAIATAAAVLLGEGAGARETAIELLAATRRR